MISRYEMERAWDSAVSIETHRQREDLSVDIHKRLRSLLAKGGTYKLDRKEQLRSLGRLLSLNGFPSDSNSITTYEVKHKWKLQEDVDLGQEEESTVHVVARGGRELEDAFYITVVMDDFSEGIFFNGVSLTAQKARRDGFRDIFYPQGIADVKLLNLYSGIIEKIEDKVFGKVEFELPLLK